MKIFKKALKAGLLGLAALLGMPAAQGQTFHGERTDFRDETIYFAMTTRFYDGDPTNNVTGWDHANVQIANGDPDWRGDFKGLIDKLDYIKALGFTAVWITPVTQNCSGTDFHGYHSMDFSTVDLRYESRTNWGAEKDVRFQDLIDAAHAKGMKIILDIVLNHTGNFGEAHFAPLFKRDQNIRNQATPEGSLIPDESKLGANYWSYDPKEQYAKRFCYLKNTDGTNKDSHNYWHHVATSWNWDYPNRWWGQIAGDCVDLNTENPAVSEYLVQCYGKFIEMGVDGFRIDTTGHISRLTFNTSFIPQFMALGEKYKDKRLNGAPFYMFGECCARFSDVTYRNQPNLSSYFYTWQSDPALVSQWNHDASFWDDIYIKEGDDSARPGNMALCEQEASDQPTSDNAFLKNGAWHEPDYSKASGFNIIDFPMHYNFNNASAAVHVAKSGDQYYNDATYNVVYVDSHDYCPGPNDGTRFNGGTAQWAENLSLMFTFRGIPCLYYGSEVEFKKGMKVDAGGTDNPVKDSGRAYFGEYLEGNVTATDFGQYTADGNVSQTLNADLAQHVRRLNLIRAAVPALRKGQYTFDGCSANGGHAFKRAYKDSYALVAVNGGATFTGCPEGTYTDLVTGKTYTGSTITVDAPQNQGQLRVLVKDWKGGKVGEDGKFIYETASVDHGGNVTFADKPASQFYTADDVVGSPAVVFDPAGGDFITETQTVNVSLNDAAVSGSYTVAGGETRELTPGTVSSFTIGEGMKYNETVTVTWTARGDNGETTGTVTYKKVDPNAVITVYCKADAAPNLYIWDADGNKLNGAWPGARMTQTAQVKTPTGDVETFWCFTVTSSRNFNVIFNNNGAQAGDIKGITSDVYYEYDGGTTANKLTGYSVVPAVPAPRVVFSPNGGTFTESCTVSASLNEYAVSGSYTLDGRTVTLTPGNDVTFTLTESATVTWTATDADGKVTEGSVEYTITEAPQGIRIYVKAASAPYLYAWTDGSEELCGCWPGKQLAETAQCMGPDGKYSNFYVFVANAPSVNVIFHNGSGAQTGNIEGITSDSWFEYDGARNYTKLNNYTGVDDVAYNTSGTIGVRVADGVVYISSPVATGVQVVSLTGVVRTVPVAIGETAVEGLHGFYIIAGQKVLVK